MPPDNITAAARHHWWLFLLRGTAALAFGVLTLWWPGATLVVLMAFIAAYALVDGLVALVYAFQLRPLFERWWVLLLQGDRKSTRLNSSHGYISYAVFCLKKKKHQSPHTLRTSRCR